MNIDDVAMDSIVMPKTTVVAAIFEHQHDLTMKYKDIEKKNGANFPVPPWNIDDKFVQWRLKDLFWRVTEELAEALDGGGFRGMANWEKRWNDDADVRHFFEELADALHFLVEASLVGGLEPVDIQEYWEADIDAGGSTSSSDIQKSCADIVWAIGLAANCLKNKPWKLTQMPTDKPAFNRHMMDAWCEFIDLWEGLGCSQEFVYKLYFRKNAVNQFRQRSNY